MDGRRPPSVESGEGEGADVGEWEHGWQYHASDAREKARMREFWNALEGHGRARLRSQLGPGAAAWLVALPTTKDLQIRPTWFAIALRLRLWLPLPAYGASCPWCSEALDPWGFHLLACTAQGRLRARATGLERAWLRVVREAGATRSVFQPRVGKLGIQGIAPGDRRRLDVAAYGLEVRGGLPLVLDATLRSPFTGHGAVRSMAATVNGSTFAGAYADKHRVYGNDVAGCGQVAFVVVAAEVFGRFDENSRELVQDLVRAHCEDTCLTLRRRLKLGWSRRWWALLSVALQVAVAASIAPNAPAFEEAPEGSGRLAPWHRAAHDHVTLLEAEHEGPEVGESRLPLR